MPRRIGIEFEFSNRSVNDNHLVDAFEHAVSVVRMANVLDGAPGCVSVDYDEDVICWTVKEDGSCGWEVTTPAFNATLPELRQIGEIVDIARRRLVQDGGRRNIVDSRCGLHVHIEAADLSQEQKLRVLNNCLAVEPALFAIHPPSRSDNAHVYGLREHNSGSRITHLVTEHDCCVNYRGYGGVRFEFRHAAGTARSSKFIPWTLICLIFVTGSRTTTLQRNDDRNVEVLADAINQLDTQTDWLEAEKPSIIAWCRERYARNH